MEKMERKIQEVAFDVEIQYCNPDIGRQRDPNITKR